MSIKLESYEIKKLARELGAYYDFEYTANGLMDDSIEQPRLSFRDILYSWAVVLSKQKTISKSAALCWNPDTAKLDPISPSIDSERMWDTLLDSNLGKRITERIRANQSFSCPLIDTSVPGIPEDQFLLVSSCPGSDPPAALAASCGIYEEIPIIQRTIDNAATRAALFLAMLRAREESERGYREMAARVAHMSSGSIVLAQLRLGAILKRQRLNREHVYHEIEEALNNLGEAQQGLDRARLLGVPWSKYAEDIQLVPFLAEIGEELNRAVDKKVVSEDSLREYQAEALHLFVSASPVRLKYAIRDLILGTWILTNQEDPVHLTIANGGMQAEIRVEGGKTNLPLGKFNGKLDAMLRDPAVFLLSPDRYSAERSIGFHMAWTLIEEIQGAVRPEILEDQRLRFVVELPLAREGAKAWPYK